MSHIWQNESPLKNMGHSFELEIMSHTGQIRSLKNNGLHLKESVHT